jgi:ubiquinone/menaquinone biosynthesis C-methylase UbiE
MARDDSFSIEEFDVIAETVFFPIYPLDAAAALKLCGRSEGECLDIGCGGGHFGLNIARQSNMRITLLDVMPECVERALQRAAEWGLSSRVSGVVSDVLEMQLPEGHYDLIVSRGSIGFWGDAAEIECALRRIYALLAPGGMSYIGGGLGNADLQKEIHGKMKAINPEFPNNVYKKTNGLEARDYAGIAARVCRDHHVIDDETGMWAVMRSPVA